MDEKPAKALIDSQVRHVAIVVVVTLTLGVVGLFLMGNLDAARNASVAYVVGLLGTVGGTANNYRKLQALTGVPDEEVKEVPASLVTGRIYLSPLIGAVFALALYLLFMGGVLSGGLFPDFACSGEDFTSYRAFADCNPTTNADVALAMVWGFVAGFAENLVPNVLDKLAIAAIEDSPDSGTQASAHGGEGGEGWGTAPHQPEDDEDQSSGKSAAS